MQAPQVVHNQVPMACTLMLTWSDHSPSTAHLLVLEPPLEVTRALVVLILQCACSGRNNVRTGQFLVNFRKYPVNSLFLWQNVRTKKAQFGELSYRSRHPVQCTADQKTFHTEENRREVDCGEQQRSTPPYGSNSRQQLTITTEWRHWSVLSVLGFGKDSSQCKTTGLHSLKVRRMCAHPPSRIMPTPTCTSTYTMVLFKKAQSSRPCEYTPIARALAQSSMDAASTMKIKRKFERRTW